tara:strand:+ start:5820 stop:6284 length:465 start_codon:yes stop_codon:yes gene_type:complete
MTNSIISHTNNIFNPEIWGPHYWFFLYTLALSYPLSPNDVSKKKYYDFIQNLPLFIPVPDIGNTFSRYLDRYPVTPYLDSRESMIKWVHFIHNKINIYLGKPEVTYYDAMDKYYENYKIKKQKMREERKNKHKYIFGAVIFLLISLIIFLYFSK